MPRRAWPTPGAIGPRVKAIRNVVAGVAAADDDDDDGGGGDEEERPTPLPPLQEQPFAKPQRDAGAHLTRGCDEEGGVRGRRRGRTRAAEHEDEEEANDSWWTPCGGVGEEEEEEEELLRRLFFFVPHPPPWPLLACLRRASTTIAHFL